MAYAAAHDHPKLIAGGATPLTPRTLSAWLLTLLERAPGLGTFLASGVVKAILVKKRA